MRDRQVVCSRCNYGFFRSEGRFVNETKQDGWYTKWDAKNGIQNKYDSRFARTVQKFYCNECYAIVAEAKRLYDINTAALLTPIFTGALTYAFWGLIANKMYGLDGMVIIIGLLFGTFIGGCITALMYIVNAILGKGKKVLKVGISALLAIIIPTVIFFNTFEPPENPVDVLEEYSRN